MADERRDFQVIFKNYYKIFLFLMFIQILGILSAVK